MHDGHAQQLGPEFVKDYSFADLGQVPGLPPRQGGLVPLRGDPDTLLIGGYANTPAGKLYAVKVTRDGTKSIVAFGPAVYYAEAPYNDGGLVYTHDGTLLCAQWPVCKLGQLKLGSRVPDPIIDLGAPSHLDSLASLNFFPPSGHLKMLAWSGGRWFDSQITPAAGGSYRLHDVRHVTTLGGGPEGFVYVPEGSPQFPTPSVLVAEWSAGNIAAYEVAEEGDPMPATRRLFMGRLTGAEGGMIDPLTGDYLFTTFGGGDRVVRVDGLNIPKPSLHEVHGHGLDRGFTPPVPPVGPSSQAADATSPGMLAPGNELASPARVPAKAADAPLAEQREPKPGRSRLGLPQTPTADSAQVADVSAEPELPAKPKPKAPAAVSFQGEEKARRERAVAEEVRLAKLLLATNPAAAHRRLQAVLDQHPSSPAAQEAKKLLARATPLAPAAPQEKLEAKAKKPRPRAKEAGASAANVVDPEQERLGAKAVELAQRILAGHPEQFKERLHEIIAQYPETHAAQDARRMLEELSEPSAAPKVP
jgi:hypothetical protein